MAGYEENVATVSIVFFPKPEDKMVCQLDTGEDQMNLASEGASARQVACCICDMSGAQLAYWIELNDISIACLWFCWARRILLIWC